MTTTAVAFPVRVEKVPERRVAFLRHVGPYTECGPTFQKLGMWAGPRGLFGPGTPTFYTDEDGHVMMSIQAWQHHGGESNAENHGQIMRTYQIKVDAEFTPSVKLTRVDL